MKIDELAKLTLCSSRTIMWLQDEDCPLRIAPKTHKLLRLTMEERGVVFGDDGASVRLRHPAGKATFCR
jgi:hypothetical protein